MTDDQITQLYERWRSGDAVAAEALFEAYSERLVALANKQLSVLVKRRVEGADVVQSVFRSFFQRSAEGEFPLNTSDEIWRLLVTITIRKAQSQGRRHSSAKRAVNAESGDAPLDALPKQAPGPEETVVLLDQIEHLLEGESERDAEIFGLRMTGHGRTEISQQLGVSRQTVYRTLQRFRDKLTKAE